MRQKDKLEVLITGANGQTGYATARSLANLGIQLIGLSSNLNSRFCQSRLWDHIVEVNNNTEAYLEKLITLGKSATHKKVLIPTQDDVVTLMSDNRDELKKYYEFVYPEKSSVDLLMDKTAFHQWAIEHGFPVPDSYIVGSKRELDTIIDQIKFPIVLKPLFRTKEWMKMSRFKVLELNNKSEMENIDFDIFETAPKFVIQQWIPGGDGNVHFCLMYVDRNGREIGYYTGRKLLQWPILTGNTAIGVGNFNNEVHKLAKDVLLKAKLRGLGSLEVKKSDEDNKYYITEPTVGRNNYQSYLAVAGGVNLTQMAYYDAINDPKRICYGVKRKATWIDENNTIEVIKNSRHHKDFHYIQIIKGLSGKISFSHFNLNDPIPFIFFLKEFPRSLLVILIPRRIRELLHHLKAVLSARFLRKC